MRPFTSKLDLYAMLVVGLCANASTVCRHYPLHGLINMCLGLSRAMLRVLLFYGASLYLRN